MVFRRKSRKDRMIATARRWVRRPRGNAATTVGVVSGLAALTAASSGVSALRQKQG